jgi:hypothetical protein
LSHFLVAFCVDFYRFVVDESRCMLQACGMKSPIDALKGRVTGGTIRVGRLQRPPGRPGPQTPQEEAQSSGVKIVTAHAALLARGASEAEARATVLRASKKSRRHVDEVLKAETTPARLNIVLK